ncbi:MAG TPA: transketolase C-terminal domain-containing protein [Microthrixaceae bacterium]|nr:transketolase C-terminal domain-containing protein [Microthrixaceae bacterium]
MIHARVLGDALRECLSEDPRVVIMGEDIADPYGGAFKVTKGLSTEFPDRVRTTPISEAGITGTAAGLALSGYRPVVEVMFGDFLTLTFDQIVNHITKYPSMSAGQATCPVIVRTPMGGGRGYGPTHSQSLEKYFLGIPHLRVLAASTLQDPLEMFRTLLDEDDAALVIEHKLLYPRQHPEDLGALIVRRPIGESGFPTVRISAVPAGDCSLTIAAYGHTAVMVAQLVDRLAVEEEIFVELVVPTQISPLDWQPIEESVSTTGALLTVEEGTRGWSWGSEVAARIHHSCFSALRAPVEVLASASDIIPSARQLEDRMLVGVSDIEGAIRRSA